MRRAIIFFFFFSTLDARGRQCWYFTVQPLYHRGVIKTRNIQTISM